MSCDKENEILPTTPTIDSLSEFISLPEGVRILEFVEDGINKTHYFSPYVFTFSTNGTIEAVSLDNTVNDTYRLFKDDGKIELEMLFPNFGEFDELRDDWYFMSQSANSLLFNDSEDILKFQIN